MKPDADLTPPGVAATIASFLEALDLEDVTIVGNDSGGAMSQILVTRHPERIGRLVLTNCDTYENFPPGIFKAMPPLAKLPGGMTLLSLPFRSGAVARAAFKPFARKPIPAELIASWMAPGLNDPGVRHDLKKVTVDMNKRYTLEAAEKLRGSQLPILFTWAPGDKLFPISGAERLAAEAGNARIVEIPDAGTFVRAGPAPAAERGDRRRSPASVLKRTGVPRSSQSAAFSSDRAGNLPRPPTRTES